MSRIIILLFLLQFNNICHAQNWTKYTTGVYNNYVTPVIGKIVIDSINNIYATGPKDINQYTYIAKWSGTSWQKLGNVCNNNNGDLICDIDLDKNGDLYIGTTLLINNNFENRILKWTGSTWQQIGNLSSLIADNMQYIMSIECISSNEIYCAGFFRNDSNKCFVAKWNGIEWSELGKINANNCIQKILKAGVDEQGQSIILATGQFTNSIGKPYVAQYANQTWTPIESPASKLENHAYLLAMASNNKGEIYVAGKADTNYNTIVSRWNGQQWQNLPTPVNIGYGWSVRSLVVDNNGYPYMAGGRYDSLLFDESAVISFANNSWTEVGGFKSFYEKGDVNSIAFDKNNCLYAAGGFTDSNSQNFVKQICNVNTSISNFNEIHTILIYPNPTYDYFIFNTSNGTSVYNLRIYDIDGKLVIQTQAKNFQRINISDLTKSLYYIDLSNNKEHYTQKLLID